MTEYGGNRLTDGLRSEGDTVLLCCGEERAYCKSEDLDLPINLRHQPHLWSQAYGSDRKNEIAADEVSLRVAG